MHRLFDGLVPKLVGGAVNVSTFHASTCKPHGEAVGIVVASGALAVAGFGQFDHRCSAELAAPDDESIVQQGSLMQVLDERGDRPVRGLGQTAVARLEISMAVPGNGFTVVNLHEAHASFDSSTGHERLSTVHGLAIRPAHMRR